TVPFIHDGRWVASLSVTDEDSRRWTEKEMLLLENVIANIWPLIERARSEKTVRRSERRLRFLSNVTKNLLSSLDTSAILREIAENALPALRNFFFFGVLNENQQISRVAWAHDCPEHQEHFNEVMKSARLLPYTQSPVEYVISVGEPVFEPDITDEWRRQIAESHEHLELMRWADFHSMISTPIK